MKAARKKGICFVATFFFLVQSMIGCVASESSQSAFNATSDEMSSEVIATAVSTKTASPTTEPALTPDVITDEQLLASWSELYNTLCSEFVDYSETAANCIPDKKSITWNSFIYPWRNNMEELKTSYDELAQESQNGTDNYQYEKIIEYVNSAYGELMTCWMIASDIINGDSTDKLIRLTLLRVDQIFEYDIYDNGSLILTEILATDADMNVFYVYYIGEVIGVYAGDKITMYALPMDYFTFETSERKDMWAIACAAAYVK